MTTTTTIAPSLRRMLSVCSRIDWADASEATLQNAACTTRHLGMLQVDQITTATLDDWVAQLRHQGLSSSRIKALLSTLRVMLRRAQRMGHIRDLPLFPEPRTLPAAEPRALVLKPEWIEELLDVLSERDHAEEARIVSFLLQTGMRVSECLDLTWDRVSLHDAQPLVLLTNTKGKKARRVPLNQHAQMLLNQQRIIHPRCGVWGVKLRTLQARHKAAVDLACARLGLGEEVRHQWNLHTLRHTCLTRLAELGWSAPQLQQFAGHSSLALTQRYVHAAAIALPQMPSTL